VTAGKNSLEVPLFGQSVVRLVTVPATSFTLDRPSRRLDRLQNAFPITGVCQNIPDGTPCVIEVTVKLDGAKTELRPRPDEANRQGVFVVGSDARRFKIEAPSEGGGRGPVVLDLFEDGLVGKGRLTVRIRPGIPHCNEGRDESIVIEFDNRLAVNIHPDLQGPPAAPMGTAVTFEPACTGAFLGLAIEVTVVEYEGDPDARGAVRDPFKPQGLKKLIAWDAGDRAAKTWRLGCTGGDAEVQFLYPEPEEILPYEFAWKASALLPDGGAVDVLPFAKLATGVGRPRLVRFDLSKDQEMSRSEAEAPVAGYRVTARLVFAGLAKDIRFSCALSLWRAVREGGKTKLERAEKGDAQFLYDTAEESAKVDLGLDSSGDGLFAVLHFPDLAMPIATVIDCGDLPFFDEDPGAGGSFSSALLGQRVCSEEAKALRPRGGAHK